MIFKPVTETYKFNDDELISIYPEYIRRPLATWIKFLLWRLNFVSNGSHHHGGNIDIDFINKLNLHLRAVFPLTFNNFLEFIFEDNDRTTNFLGICLQNYATKKSADSLEDILSTSGSAYSVMITKEAPSASDIGVADLTNRVSSLVVQSSEEALSDETLIRAAWHACYSRNPDYEKTVSKCCDVIEKNWGKKYFSNDPKPQIKKFVHGFVADPSKLIYKGSSIVDPKNLITSIAEKFSDIRGQHTAGKGRVPSKEEAEMVLHYTIFIWNIDK